MNAPNKQAKTAKVELFVAAWDLVYTSGNLMRPNALITLMMEPIKTKITATHSRISFAVNDNPPFNILRKGNCSDKG